MESTATWKILLLLLATAISTSQASVFGRRIRPGTSDLVTMESATNAAVVAPPEPDETPSESKRSEVFRNSERLLVKPPSGYKFSVQNVTNTKYNYQQWYAEPKGMNHNEATMDLRSRANAADGGDLSALGSSYSEGYNQGQIDYRHHHDEPRSKEPTHADHHYHYDHFHEMGNPSPAYEEKGYDYEPKPRTRKLKKKCKDKKHDELSRNADTIVHSMTKQTGAEVTRFDIRAPLSNSGPKREKFIPNPTGFSASAAPNAGGKTIDNGNHLHIHSHHYHYDADGNKVNSAAPAGAPRYQNIIQGIQKLLPLALSGVAKLNNNNFPVATQTGKPMMDPSTADVKLAEEGPKKGYHYTGPHNSYGRKTYHRMKDDNPSGFAGDSYGDNGPSGLAGDSYSNNGPSGFAGDSYSNSGPSGFAGDSYSNSGPSGFAGDSYGDNGPSDLHDHSSNMFKYGPFATDEYRDGSGPFPNEVNLSVDRPHSHEYDEKPYGGHDSHEHPPHDYHDDHHSPGYSGDHPSAEYDDKAPYVPYDNIKANREKNAVFVGYKKPEDNDGESYHPYDDNSKVEPPRPHSHTGPSINPGPPEDITNSFNYPNDEMDIHMYDPEKHSHYKDLKPEPDPLSIPKNARVIEHHIRLDPKYFTMFHPVPLDFGPHSFNQHIPVHKLIPDPLKSPYPQKPVGRIPGHNNNPKLNQMLHAYQGRSVYHKWW